MSFYFRANNESKNGNSININVTAFKNNYPLHCFQIYSVSN